MAARIPNLGRLARNYAIHTRLRFLKCNTRQARHFHMSANLFGDPVKILMPALSPTMTQGTIVKWYKKEGDTIAPGDLLCDIQTDKAVVSHEMEEDGILAKILIPENTADVTIGRLIALMVEEGEDWQNVEVPADTAEEVAPAAPAASAAPPTGAPTPHADAHVVDHGLGPAVRSLMEIYGLCAGDVTGTGPHGEVLKGDILKYVKDKNLQATPPPEVPLPTKAAPKTPQLAAAPKVSTPPRPPPTVQPIAETDTYIDIPLTTMRKVIATRLTESKQTIPHAWGSISCRMNELLQLRKEFAEDSVKVSVNDFIVKAAAVALQRVPEVNAVWGGEAPRLLSNIDICVAVATDAGLITPIIKDAIGIGVLEISAKTKELAGKARDGKLMPEEYQGGTFTISNLGMFGITEFSAVINPPQACILAVGASRPTLDLEGQPQTEMTVTLSSDARIVDEVLGATFLDAFQEIIENPALMLGQGPAVDIQKLFAK